MTEQNESVTFQIHDKWRMKVEINFCVSFFILMLSEAGIGFADFPRLKLDKFFKISSWLQTTNNDGTVLHLLLP